MMGAPFSICAPAPPPADPTDQIVPVRWSKGEGRHELQLRFSREWVQLNVRVTLSAGKGAFWVIPEWVQGVAAGQMDESWINKHGQLDSKGGPWQNAFPKSRSLPGAKPV